MKYLHSYLYLCLTDLLYLAAAVIISPRVIYRMVRHGRYRAGWGHRLGWVNRRAPEKACVWIHAVSVGEVNAARTLIERLGEQLPDYEIVISATTDTGFDRASALYGQTNAVFYFPADVSFIMRRAFDRLRPNICLLMELELWPNLSRIAKERDIPIVIVNGRLSDRSFPRYKLIRPLVRRMFGTVSRVLAQSQEYADRFIYLGCPTDRVIVTSSLKYDTAQIADTVEGADGLAVQLNLGGEPFLVAGGTGSGEEKIILDVFAELKKRPPLADIRLAIVPRKPERFDEVAALIALTEFDFVRYSEIKATGRTVTGKPAVILGDTMGDLKKFFCLATGPVLAGRSLTPHGGSDMMEPAALGKCTIFGPHTYNFKQTVNALLSQGGAIQVRDGDELLDVLGDCYDRPDHAMSVAQAGRKVIRQNQGATERSVTAIRELLQG